MSGLEPIEDVVEDWTLASHRLGLSSPSQAAYAALLDSASVALNLTNNEADMRGKVVEAITETIKAQEKWWVLGAEHGDDAFDPLTRDLIHLMVNSQLPEAIPVMLETLYRKVQQDDTYIRDIIFPSPEFQLNYVLISRFWRSL
jgi:hypothetical protein